MKHLNIRWRVALWNTAGFAVVLVGFGVLVYSLLRQSHYSQVDRGLKIEFGALAAEANRTDDAKRALEAWVRKHPKTLAIVFDSRGQIVAQSEGTDAAVRPPMTDGIAVDSWSDSLTVPKLGHLRRRVGRIVFGKEVCAVVLLSNLDHVDEEMGLVAASLVITAPVALGFAAALAYLLARSALVPVEELRQRANEITADRLDRRVPITNPADEIGLLAQTVNSMIERLQRSFMEIRRFTADASHELRTPLAVIRSESEMGLEPSATLDDARQRFSSILEECARLTCLTDQLLTLSREDAGVAPPRRERLPLLPLIRETIETMAPLAAEKRQTLAAMSPEDAVVSGDSERLRQVLYNLLANAIKYTPPGGTVEVELERRHGEAVLSVRDNGVGISAEHLPHVFDRFYRVDKARSQREGGAGLGLSIVKSIVAAHGGRVEAVSTPGAGSTFRVFLPIASCFESASENGMSMRR